MATPKQAHTLTSYYKSIYQKKYGKAPVVNRYSARWGFDAVLMDMPVQEAEALLDYYLETASPNSHSLEWFFYNYEKLVDAKKNRDADAALAARLRRESQQRAERWRNKIG